MNFKRNRLAIVEACGDGYLNDEEFVLLYDLNRSTNLELPYWEYDPFDLDQMNDDECRSEFRFLKDDIYSLYHHMNFPQEIRCPTGFKVK